MDLKELLENKQVIIVLVLLGLIGGAFVGIPAFENRIKNKVIQDLQKGYAPGPYAPGFDPDIVNPNTFNNRPQTQPQPHSQPLPRQQRPSAPQQRVRPPDAYTQPQEGPKDWSEEWENDRGYSLPYIINQ